jgi:uncharacterized membrane protein
MTEFSAALGAFLAAHLIPAGPGLRARLVHLMGRGIYVAAYSALSLALLAWLVAATQRAESPILWDPAPWHWHVTLASIPVATFLLVAGLLAPNPLSISFRQGAVPGAITSLTRHPVLWAFLAWALAHIPPNGDLASVILFGGMAALSLLGFFIVDAKARRRLGRERWRALAERTSIIPFAALLAGRAPWRTLARLLWPAFAAAALHAWFVLQGHALLIGPDPLAGFAG